MKLSNSHVLTNNQLSQDLAALKYILQNAYSGYFFKNKVTINNGLKKLRSIVEKESPKSLCNKIAESFKIVRDNHLTFQIGKERCAPEEHTGSVGERYNSDLDKVWTVDLLTKKNKKLLVISISYFPSRSSSLWTGFLEAVRANLNNSDAVFLDMRGNGGGDDAIGYDLVKLLTGEDEIITPYGPQHKVITKAGLISRWNYFYLKSEFASTLKEKKFLLDYIEKEKILFSSSKASTAITNSGKSVLKSYNALRPIYIIQDKNCGSSCESTIDFFEYINPVVRVGENTAGSVHFTNLGFVILPSSKIQINIASTFNTYKDNRFIEKIGIEPNIKVDKGEDALKFAIKSYFSKIK